MQAIEFTRALPADDPGCFAVFDLADPVPGPDDLLVAVQAVSVNPVDTKERRRGRPGSGPHVLGFDAAGVVVAVGGAVQAFAPGDRVWYAGQLDRPGSNATLQVVDARIAARAPASLRPAQAAALPLTMLTAWELLFDRFRLVEGGHGGASLLVVGGAGGVGSAMIQLARALTGMTVIATASRPETRAWCLSMGAHHVVDHRGDMAAQVAALGAAPCTHAAILSGTAANLPAVAEVIAPQGAIGLIDDPPLGAGAQGVLKRKSVSVHWEFMFTRPMARTPDMAAQGAILARVAALVDEGRLRTTLTRDMGPMTPDTLRAAHALVETGQSIGKVVLRVG